MGQHCLSARQRNAVIANIVTACVVSSLLSTALTTALPPIMNDFSVDMHTGQWLTSGYSLAMGVVMPLSAFLITRFPTKPLYIASLGTTISGIALCAFAPNFPVMMCGRILQALGNGLFTAMAQVVILTVCPTNKQGTAMGIYGLSVSAAPVVAPVLSGFITDALGWRWIFYGSIALFAVVTLLATKAFENVLKTTPQRFDFISFAASTLAFGGITLGVGNLPVSGIASPLCFGPILAGAIAAVFFTVRQLRLSKPFLDVRTFASKPFTVSVVCSMLLYFLMMGSSVIMPLYVQNILGGSATLSGLVTMPGSLVMALVCPLAGRLYDSLGIKPLLVAGSGLLIASNGGMALIGVETSVWVASALNVVRCIAIACLMMPLVTWGAGQVGETLVAHATALLTSLRTLAGAIGAAVFTGVMTSTGSAAANAGAQEAAMHGLNISFAGMAGTAAILLLVGLVLTRSRKSTV